MPRRLLWIAALAVVAMPPAARADIWPQNLPRYTRSEPSFELPLRFIVAGGMTRPTPRGTTGEYDTGPDLELGVQLPSEKSSGYEFRAEYHHLPIGEAAGATLSGGPWRSFAVTFGTRAHEVLVPIAADQPWRPIAALTVGWSWQWFDAVDRTEPWGVTHRDAHVENGPIFGAGVGVEYAPESGTGFFFEVRPSLILGETGAYSYVPVRIGVLLTGGR
jgi:hypothetical protein